MLTTVRCNEEDRIGSYSPNKVVHFVCGRCGELFPKDPRCLRSDVGFKTIRYYQGTLQYLGKNTLQPIEVRHTMNRLDSDEGVALYSYGDGEYLSCKRCGNLPQTNIVTSVRNVVLVTFL